TLVDLLHGAEEIAVVPDGTRHDEAALQEFRVYGSEDVFEFRRVDPFRVAARDIHGPQRLNTLGHARVGIHVFDGAEREVGDWTADIIPVAPNSDGLENG